MFVIRCRTWEMERDYSTDKKNSIGHVLHTSCIVVSIRCTCGTHMLCFWYACVMHVLALHV